jgi:hypothetical protein
MQEPVSGLSGTPLPGTSVNKARRSKRAEGKRHTQALIALARRRVNVVWAMLRDGTTFESRSVP